MMLSLVPSISLIFLPFFITVLMCYIAFLGDSTYIERGLL